MSNKIFFWTRAKFFVMYMVSLAVFFFLIWWIIDFAYTGRHDMYDPDWVVPAQLLILTFDIGANIIAFAMLVIPDDWRRYEVALERLKKKS